MAELTRKELRKIFEDAGMEIPPKDVLGQICDLHTSALDGMNDTIKELNEKLKNSESKNNNNDGYKEKYEKEHKAFEDYKNDVTAKENKAAKENAVKAYFEGKNISGKNLEIAMRGCTAEIAALELEDGKIKDTATLDELVNGTYAGLVQTTHTTGTSTSNPPANGGGKSTKTMAEIMAIKDTAERQKAIAENPEVFGLDFSD